MLTLPTHRRPMPLAALLATSALAALAGGCQDPNMQRGETFDDNDHPAPIGLIAESQAAAGAKQDATLYDRHFRGDRLDPLGQSKLDLMLKGTANGDPVQVFLDMPDDQAAARRAAVAAYLQQAGVPAERIELATGPNPHCTTPTAYNLSTVYKPEGNGYSGEAADLGVTGGLGANGPGGTIGK
jgi:type IV pilus biogenesis protein CpaD/CtpE